MHTKLEEIRLFISESGISQKYISREMGMNHNTFRLKLNSNFPQYNFSETELANLCKVLDSVAERILVLV